jgi:diacylglycerol kinase family enzyme
VGIALARKKAVHLDFEFDDGEVFSESILLTAVANGAYCGGGFKGVPDADPADGLLNVFVARDVTRRTFLSLLSKYRKGTHIDDPRAEYILIRKACEALRVSSKDRMHMAVDGEVFLTDSVSFRIEPKAIRFVLPQAADDAARTGQNF